MEDRHFGNYAEGMTTHSNSDSFLVPDGDKIRRLYGHSRREHDAATPWEMYAEFAGTINNRRMDDGYEDKEHSFYRGQPRTASGKFRRSMMRYSHEFEEGKERVAGMLAEECEPEELLDKAIKEAGEFVTYAISGKPFEAMKEFAELAILVCAIAEHLPEELTEAAEMEALEYYERKVDHRNRSRHMSEHYRHDNPLADYSSRRSYGYRR